jgi:hypothetical protein
VRTASTAEGWQPAEGEPVSGHQVRSYPSPARLGRELAGLVLPGIAEADQPTETWGIL